MPRTSSRSAEIVVKVARTGGRATEVVLEDEKTVSAALNGAGVSFSSTDRIRVNGKNATETTKLKNGDIVTVAGKISGGSI